MHPVCADDYAVLARAQVPDDAWDFIQGGSGGEATIAANRRVEGVIVSNHGGRQLDGAIASLEALPEVAAVTGERCAVLFDGGVRSGSDVLKAIALGAKGVLIGRPALWALAAGGAEGVAGLFTLLRSELHNAMALAGQPDLRHVDRSAVAYTAPATEWAPDHPPTGYFRRPDTS